MPLTQALTHTPTSKALKVIPSQQRDEPSHYLLGGYVFGCICLFVCLFVLMSVCLFVSSITQKVRNGLQWNFMEGSWVVH